MTAMLFEANSSCLTQQQVPDGYGPNGLSGVAAVCASSGCASCSLDYLACDRCKQGYYYIRKTKSCHQATDLPDGYGFGADKRQAFRCRDSHCKQCRTDFRHCDKCDPARKVVLDRQSKRCVPHSEISQGFGINSENLSLEACRETGCLDCREDHLKCLKCDASKKFYLLKSSSQCCNISSFPEFHGPDLFASLVVPCIPSSCRFCPASHINCVDCSKLPKHHYFPQNGSCLKASEVPAGFGIDEASIKLLPCLSDKCVACRSDYRVCSKCRAEAGYLLLAGSCLEAKDLPRFFGSDWSRGVARRCSGEFCLRCAADFRRCEECMEGKLHLNHSCITADQIPAGMGVDSDSQSLQRCRDENCEACRQNVAACAKCKSDFYFDRFLRLCKSLQQLPQGTGFDSETGLPRVCSNFMCIDCRRDFRSCKQCSEVACLDSLAGSCVPTTLIAESLGCHRGHIRPCLEEHCIECRGDTSVCSRCETRLGSYLTDQSRCSRVDEAPHGKGIDRETGRLRDCSAENCLLSNASSKVTPERLKCWLSTGTVSKEESVCDSTVDSMHSRPSGSCSLSDSLIL